MFRDFFPIIPCFIAVLTLLDRNPVCAEAPPRPNIVFLLADDLGYADLGCQGARDFETPHLDRMAKEGARLTSYYAGASEGKQSRAALFSGRYPDRMDSSEGPALAALLKSAGYETICIGKWEASGVSPTEAGFDRFFGVKSTGESAESLIWEEGQAADPTIERRELTSRFTQRAIQVIREKRDKPLFLLLSYTVPRVPLRVSEPFSGSAKYGLYGDMMQELDWSVGAILGCIGDTEGGAHTLAIFTSDNGPWLEQGAHGGKADPFRGGKYEDYEGGHRVPCLVWWPKRIPANATRDGMVAGMDWLPTLGQVAGAEMPAAEPRIDGVDVWPYLAGHSVHSPREVLFLGRGVVRRGDWKLYEPGRYREFIVPPGAQVKDGQVEYAAPRLFHLGTDPGERRDLAGKKEYAPLVAELTKLCAERRQSNGKIPKPEGEVKAPVK